MLYCAGKNSDKLKPCVRAVQHITHNGATNRLKKNIQHDRLAGMQYGYSNLLGPLPRNMI